MNKEDLKEKIQEVASKNDYDLPNGWYNKNDSNLQKLLNEIEGKKEQSEEVVQEVEIVKSPQNPFGEELVDIILPLDNQNKKIKTKFFAVNGKPIEFPLGKKTKMPRSYYELYMNSQEAYMNAQEKQTDNRYKEL